MRKETTRNEKARTELVGRRIAMVPHNTRIPEDEQEILRRSAEILKSQMADISRSAIKEYIENHNLRELVAEAKAKRARKRAK
jgi:hypothetical protein